MNYISTRGGIAPLSFTEAVMMGLATDGGLLLPETLPEMDEEAIDSWRHLTFQQLALAILSRFISDTDIPANDLQSIIERSYATFVHPEVTPVIKKGDVHILELFHGPTLAFKDVALQFLGNVFEYILGKTKGRMNILGATSGDTGSAAIYGVRGKERINIFILHPYKRVSRTQELQMTSVMDANVFNIAIRGTFDDGQAIVKQIFNDIPFKKQHGLGAVNSINWARILAQIVYYVYAWLRVSEACGARAVDFSVPTGNFGDIFAGFVAKRLLSADRIRRLILATNENDLLARFILKGDYSKGIVVPTSSPSMDIQVASNFERYLYYLYNEDSKKTQQAMETFAATGKLDFSDRLKDIQADFRSKSVSETETIETIGSFYAANNYILDPHTAVGVNAAVSFLDREEGVPMVCLATAHPAKFSEAVSRAIGRGPAIPSRLAGLEDRETRCEVMEADAKALQDYISRHAL